MMGIIRCDLCGKDIVPVSNFDSISAVPPYGDRVEIGDVEARRAGLSEAAKQILKLEGERNWWKDRATSLEAERDELRSKVRQAANTAYNMGQGARVPDREWWREWSRELDAVLYENKELTKEANDE